VESTAERARRTLSVFIVERKDITRMNVKARRKMEKVDQAQQ
jgi:hypothetical protein